MDFDIMKASARLSELDLKILSGDMKINVLWFRASECAADSLIDRHTHSTFEFHFVYAGSSLVELDGGSFTVREGEFYITAPGVFHRQYNYSGYVEFSLNCELTRTEADDSEAGYIIDLLRRTPCRPFADTAGACGLFIKALKEADCQYAGYYGNIRSLIILLITASVRAINKSAPANYAVPVKQKKDEYRFLQIRNYIRDNISLPVTVTDIANYMFLSSKQVSRIIKEASGMSAKELIQEYKFREARKMLIEQRDLTIRQISESLGFSSEFYFNQFFKRKEGYPPGVYRDNVR